MKRTVAIRKALSDKKLLGGVLVGPSWRAWRVLLIAAMGEKLTEAERVIFTKLTGRAHEPLQRVEELVGVVGRRGGKSRAMATLATYIGGLCKHDLVAGETGVCLCVAPDTKQAGIILEYTQAAFEQSPILRQLISNRTADALELTNSVSIEVRAANFRRLRGPTYCAAIADEAAFWMPDESSSNPDTEILNSIRPGLLTTRGPLVIVSSPYAKKGVLWNRYRKHFGPDGDTRILVAQGSSRDFNPTLPQSEIDRALADDRAAASAEYLAQFRSDLEAFVSLEVVEACVGGHVELPYAGRIYRAFCDPSGGSGGDAFTLAIGHREADGKIVIDAVREMRPPFSPSAVIDEYAALLKSYDVTRVSGDRFGGEFPREQFRKHGISYRVAEKPKSDLYRDLLPLLNGKRIELPANRRLIDQIVGLERRTGWNSKDSIDHARGASDDLANSVAGAADVIIAAERLKLMPPQFGTYGRGTLPGEVIYGEYQEKSVPHRLDGPTFIAGADSIVHVGYATKR